MCQLLNHPHLSAHIDETDEDALSYMTDLEVRNSGVLSASWLFCMSANAHSYIFVSFRSSLSRITNLATGSASTSDGTRTFRTTSS